MRILLINPPIRENTKPVNFPIGLGIIAAVLEKNRHTVEVLDLNALRASDDETIDKLKAFKNQFGIIGIGGLITTYKYMKWIIPHIKVIFPGSKIVVGGGVVTENPDIILKNTPTDIAVIGEGEETIVELLEVLGNHGEISTIDGIAYRNSNDEIIINSSRTLIKDLDSLPAYHLFPMDIYLKNQSHSKILGRMLEMNIITSRGCPFSCNFCYHIFSRGVRYRSINNVIDEIKFLIKNYNVRSFTMLDETMTIDHKRVTAFCDAIEKENLKITWSCYARVSLVKEDVLKRMKRAGCYRIGFGIESGSPQILKLMNKKETVEQAGKAIEMVRKAGLICGTTFMFGYPGETRETIKETVDFCKKYLIPTSFFFTAPYPGTQLFSQVKDKVILKYGSLENFIDKLGDASDFVINLTDSSDEELIELREKSHREVKKIPLAKLPRFYFYLYQQLGFYRFFKRIIDKSIT